MIFSLPPDPGEHVLERSATPTALVERDKLDVSSLAPPKGEMESSFSWTYLFKNPRSSTLCFGEPTRRKLNQNKLLCNPTSSTLCDFTLGKLNRETEFYITKHTTLVHTGTPFSVPKSSSGTNRVSVCHPSLVTTSSSRWIPDKPKIEVTKAQMHHTGKNGEHFYEEKFTLQYPKSWRHTKSNQNMGTHHTFNNCVRETFNHGFSHSEVDWGDAIDVPIKHGPNCTSNGCVLMEVDWGDILKLNYTSYGCMIIEEDWGGKFNCMSCGCPIANWQGHETHPTGHNTSEVFWGGHDPNPNHMNESLISEVDWKTHDSSVFLFLVNIDYDARPNESSIQGLWGELQHRTSSIPLIGLKTDSLATGQTGVDICNSTPISPDLDGPEQLTGESIQSFLTLVVQLQLIVALGGLVTHAQVTTLSKLKLTQKNYKGPMVLSYRSMNPF